MIDFQLPLLAMVTLLAGIVFAIYRKDQTERRKKDASIPPGSLASDRSSSETAH